MNNPHQALIEEKVVNSQCDAGDVVTGWVIQSDEVRTILQATIDTVLEGERESLKKQILNILKDGKIDGMNSKISNIEWLLEALTPNNTYKGNDKVEALEKKVGEDLNTN